MFIELVPGIIIIIKRISSIKRPNLDYKEIH